MTDGMYCAACGARTQADPCEGCGADPLLDGRFRLVEILGQGAHGTTWRAEIDDAIVAIKEMPLRLGAPRKLVELFEREASVLQQLRHRGIPEHHDHFVRGEGRQRAMYLVMRFVPGPSLQAMLPTHRFDEAEVLGILDGLLDVLTYLHSRSPPVIHRDIKPANVLSTDDGPVLIDFGSVRDAIRGEDLGGSTVAGTFGYMAPEQLVGDASPATDLYGLGALAVALLTRVPPHELVDRQQRVRFRDRIDVTAGTADLLTRMLAPDPEDRPASARAARDEVQRLLAGEPALPAPRALPVPVAAALPVTRASNQRIVLSMRAAGVVTDENLGHVVTRIEHELGLEGSVQHLGTIVRWQSGIQPGRGLTRMVRVTFEPDGGGTRILVSEDLTALNGALYGGIGGGVGGGVGGGLGWIPFAFVGPMTGAALLLTFFGGLFALIYRIKQQITRNRTEELRQLGETLARLLGGPVR